MITPAEYLNKKLPIIPCKEKKPIANNWPEIDFTVSDFKPGDNIGLKMAEHFDIDIDNAICKKFLPLYMEQPSAVYGRKSNPQSHYLYKGKAKHFKFALTKHFESYYDSFPHKACLIEIRSGKDKQSIVPGSKINGEDVEWNLLEGIAPYSRDANKDIGKVALAAALSIMFPPLGNRADYLYACACLLAKTKWTDKEIDEYVYQIAKKSGSNNAEIHNGKGTRARKLMKQKGRVFGYTKLKEITGVHYAGLMKIFSWVGLEEYNETLLELIEDWYYLEDTGLMYNPSTGKEIPEAIFNNNYLYDFPGGRNKDKAFKLLLKDPEFQSKKLLSKQFLPDYPYPIAEVDKKHKLLMPGRYYNLWTDYPHEPDEPREIEEEGEDGKIRKVNIEDEIKFLWEHFETILGKENWEQISQYIAMCVKNPGMKMRWVPLIISPEGVGKGLLLRIISNMMGSKYVNENVSFADITEKHSTIVVGTLFCALNEVSIDGGQYSTKRTISAKIKPFISDDFININEKGKPIYKYLNNCNAMIFSNDKNCLHIDTSSRRYYVCVVKTTTNEIEKMASSDVFKRLWAIAENYPEYLLYHFIYNVQIRDEKVYNQRAPKTPDLLDMIEDSKHDLLLELSDALEHQTPPFDKQWFRGFISLNQLIYFIRTQWKLPHPPRKLIRDWLKENCSTWKDGKKTRQIVMPDMKPRVYWLDDKGPRAYLKDLTEGELGQLAGAPYPTEYLEAQMLDYKMLKQIGDRLTPEQPDNILYQRYAYLLMDLPEKVLKEVYEAKKHLAEAVAEHKDPSELNIANEKFKDKVKYIMDLHLGWLKKRDKKVEVF